MGLLDSFGIGNIDIVGLATGTLHGLMKVVFLGIGAIAVAYLVIRHNDKKSYNEKATIWDKSSGNYAPRKTLPAKEVSLRGIPFWYIPKLGKFKEYQRYPTKRVGKSAWFMKTSHGQLINFGVEDFDTKLNELKIDFESLSVMQQVGAANRKLINEAYKKKKGLSEYAPYIGMGILILLLGIFGYLYFNQASDFASQNAASVSASEKLTEANTQLLIKIDEIITKYKLAPDVIGNSGGLSDG